MYSFMHSTKYIHAYIPMLYVAHFSLSIKAFLLFRSHHTHAHKTFKNSSSNNSNIVYTRDSLICFSFYSDDGISHVSFSHVHFLCVTDSFASVFIHEREAHIYLKWKIKVKMKWFGTTLSQHREWTRKKLLFPEIWLGEQWTWLGRMYWKKCREIIMTKTEQKKKGERKKRKMKWNKIKSIKRAVHQIIHTDVLQIYDGPLDLYPPSSHLPKQKMCALNFLCFGYDTAHGAAPKTSLLLCRHSPNAIWAILLCVHCTQKRSKIQSDQGEWHRRLFIYSSSPLLCLASFSLSFFFSCIFCIEAVELWFVVNPYVLVQKWN